MDRKIAEPLSSGTINSNDREWNTAAHNHIDTSYRHNVLRRKPGTKNTYFMIPFTYISSQPKLNCSEEEEDRDWECIRG